MCVLLGVGELYESEKKSDSTPFWATFVDYIFSMLGRKAGTKQRLYKLPPNSHESCWMHTHLWIIPHMQNAVSFRMGKSLKKEEQLTSIYLNSLLFPITVSNEESSAGQVSIIKCAPINSWKCHILFNSL